MHDTRKRFSTYKNNDTNSTLSPYSFLCIVSENAKPFLVEERRLLQEAKDLSKRFSSSPPRKFF